MTLVTLKIYHHTSKPLGVSFEEWTARWWQWLLAIPKSINPTMDSSGDNALIGQTNSKVFFLCQTVETVTQHPRRKISVSRGTSLFLPIINWISNFYEHGKTEKDLIEIATERMNVIGNLEFKINGLNIQGVEKYRFQSQFFSVDLPRDNILDLPAGKTCLFSDGYWVFTKPIVADTRLSTFGTCSSGITKIGVDYSIAVI